MNASDDTGPDDTHCQSVITDSNHSQLLDQDEWSDWDDVDDRSSVNQHEASDQDRASNCVEQSKDFALTDTNDEKSLNACQDTNKKTLLEITKLQAPVMDISRPVMKNHVKKVGALKLGSHKTKTADADALQTTNTLYEQTDSSLSTSHHTAFTSDSKTNKSSPRKLNVTAVTQPVLSAKHKMSPKPLGAEFNILSQDIKPISSMQEVDFFSDMLPNIHPKQKAVTSIKTDTGTTGPTTGKESLFAAEDTDQVSTHLEPECGSSVTTYIVYYIVFPALIITLNMYTIYIFTPSLPRSLSLLSLTHSLSRRSKLVSVCLYSFFHA